MEAYKLERNEQIAPLQERLTIVERLIADNQVQLNRLLDLYLSGDFPKEMLTERKSRLSDTITALERERDGLAAQMTADSLTDDDIKGIFDIAKEISQGLAEADSDFELRRQIIELLDVRLTCAVEDEQMVIYPRFRWGNSERLSSALTSTCRTSTCRAAHSGVRCGGFWRGARR